jgi:hypothetical protein
MPILELTDQEWQSLMVVLTKQPWEIANPILYKMAKHMRMPDAPPTQPRGDGVGESRPIWMRPAELGEG